MPGVGRKRTKNLGLPAGTQEIGGVWHWQPTTERERAERRKLRDEAKARGEKFTIGCKLGPARSAEARKKWAEVSGFADVPATEGTVGHLLQLWKRDGLTHTPKGKPRAPATIGSYNRALPLLEKLFRDVRYGKTEHEASRGQAIGTADIQRFVRDCESPAIANIALAVAANAFDHAIREGLTTYNPCDKAVKNAMEPRTREPREWEVEVLSALARPLLALMMAYEGITGDRVSEILGILRSHCTADGIRIRRKGGKWETWEWSPELRRIFSESAQLPGATKFPASPLFPGRRGKRFTYSGFNTAWQALKADANEELAAGIVDPDTLEVRAGLAVLDLHFHDLRSKTHDDAEDAQAGAGADQIGDSKAVAKKHYARREKRKKPLR